MCLDVRNNEIRIQFRGQKTRLSSFSSLSAKSPSPLQDSCWTDAKLVKSASHTTYATLPSSGVQAHNCGPWRQHKHQESWAVCIWNILTYIICTCIKVMKATKLNCDQRKRKVCLDKQPTTLCYSARHIFLGTVMKGTLKHAPSLDSLQRWSYNGCTVKLLRCQNVNPSSAFSASPKSNASSGQRNCSSHGCFRNVLGVPLVRRWQ